MMPVKKLNFTQLLRCFLQNDNEVVTVENYDFAQSNKLSTR
jgi:hypothetical protein